MLFLHSETNRANVCDDSCFIVLPRHFLHTTDSQKYWCARFRGRACDTTALGNVLSKQQTCVYLFWETALALKVTPNYPCVALEDKLLQMTILIKATADPGSKQIYDYGIAAEKKEDREDPDRDQRLPIGEQNGSFVLLPTNLFGQEHSPNA
jgi:hypothetical protein